MRKEYGNALRRLFKQKIKGNDLNLVEFKPSNGLIEPGERIYKTKMESLQFFVILIPHPMVDKFTLEVGWSETNQFPAINMRPSGFLSSDGREFKRSDFVFRVGDLLDRTDFWWTVEEAPISVNDILKSMEKISKEAAESKIIPQVEDAVQKLILNVMPFFKELYNYKINR